jgi:hypothetical protein
VVPHNLPRCGSTKHTTSTHITIFGSRLKPMAETGLQALNAFLIFFPFLLSFSIVAIRVWRRIIERQFSVG